jgi:hypothetical protein
MRRAWILGSLLLAAVVVQAAAENRILVVEVRFAGAVQDGPEAGNYYIALSTAPGLLSGPTPTGENWTHYVLYQRGRFFFARVRSMDLPRSLFRTTLPPEPYPRGRIGPDRRTIMVDLPLVLLDPSGRLVGPIKLNVVTTDRWNRPLDALGRGPDDPLGFVSFDPDRELFRRVEAPSGNAPPSYDIVGVTITLQVP